MSDDHAGAIWVLGILLVIASAATSPYWQNVAGAAASGTVQVGTGRVPVGPANVTLPALRATVAPGSGLWLTLGTLLMVIVLAGIANISEGAGTFALVLLLGIWVLFLLGHTAGFKNFFGLFMPAAAASAAPASA